MERWRDGEESEVAERERDGERDGATDKRVM